MRLAARFGLSIVAACIAAPPASGAAWLAPTRLATVGEVAAGSPALSVNADGSAVAAWAAQLTGGNYAIRVAQRAAGGQFGSPVEAVTSAAHFGNVSVATNPHGDVLLAWDGGDGSAVSVRPQGGTFSAPALVTAGDGYTATQPLAGLDDAGRGTTVWREGKTEFDMGCSTIQFRSYALARIYDVTAAGAPSPGAVVGSSNGCIVNGGAAVETPVLDVNGRGDAVAAARADFRVRWLSRSLATGSWGGGGGTATNSFSPSVAIAGTGRFVLGYVEGGMAQLRFGVAGSAPAGAIPMSGALSGYPYAVAGLSAAGDAALGFTDNPTGMNYVPFLRAVAADGTPEALGPRVAPEYTAPNYGPPLLKQGQSGTLFMAWLSSDPPAGSSALHAVVRPPGAATGAPATISGDLNQSVTAPALAADGVGGALAAFIRPDDTATRMWVTQYDANPPVLSAVSVPTGVEVGVPAAFSTQATDDWSGASVHWDFGDGSGADGPSVSHTFGAIGAVTVTLTATDGAGNQKSETRAVNVSAHPVPTVSAVRLTATRFAVSPKATAISARKRAPRGTHVRFTLAAAATAKLTFQRPAAGRRAKSGRCVKPTAKLRRAKRCTRYRADGALTRANLAAGAHDVPFSGRIGRRALRRGGHRVIVSATGAGGSASAPARSFTIVRR